MKDYTMWIFTTGLATETNTFTAWPTGARAIDAGGRRPGDANLYGACRESLVAGLYRVLSGRDGHEFVEGLFASAKPFGSTMHAVYEGLRDQILDAIRPQGPFYIHPDLSK